MEIAKSVALLQSLLAVALNADMCQTKLQTLAVNKVLLVDTSSQTVIGKAIVPDATVLAVIEDHVIVPPILSPIVHEAQALDANILVFKKNRRKRYQMTRGHPQLIISHQKIRH